MDNVKTYLLAVAWKKTETERKVLHSTQEKTNKKIKHKTNIP